MRHLSRIPSSRCGAPGSFIGANTLSAAADWSSVCTCSRTPLETLAVGTTGTDIQTSTALARLESACLCRRAFLESSWHSRQDQSSHWPSDRHPGRPPEREPPYAIAAGLLAMRYIPTTCTGPCMASTMLAGCLQDACILGYHEDVALPFAVVCSGTTPGSTICSDFPSPVGVCCLLACSCIGHVEHASLGLPS